MKKMKKALSIICAVMLALTMVMPTTIIAKTTAGEQADGSFLIADFMDSDTAESWGKGADQTEVPTDTSLTRGVFLIGEGYELDYTTDTGNLYMSNEASTFSGLNFGDYKDLKFTFTLRVDKEKNPKIDKVNNYFTIVLSTGENAGTFETYKNNECLTYEVSMADCALNDKISIVAPLADFVTQFDGMKDGVLGEADGTTPLSDIKSVSILGASMAKSEVGGTGSASNIWAFANSNWANKNQCGIRVHRLELIPEVSQNSAVVADMNTYMAQFDKRITGDITLPTEFEGSTVAWTSSNPSVVSNDGKLTIPADNTVISLTANFTFEDTSTQSAVYYFGVKGSGDVKETVIANFLNKSTCDAWGKGANQTKVPADDTLEKGAWISGEGYELDYTTDTGSEYMKNMASKFAGIDFSDYTYLKFSFKPSVNYEFDRQNNTGITSINNYITLVLSTAETTGNYSHYKYNECLTYEIPLMDKAINSETELVIPLKDFVTQFDGMKDGFLGTKDGTTPLSDIKSISILGASMAKSEVGGRGSASNIWTFANGNWANKNQCGMRIREISLVTMASLARDEVDSYISTLNHRVTGNLELPTVLSCGTAAWSSDHPEVVSDEGVLTIPSNDTVVGLTAVITGSDNTSCTATYYLGVAGMNDSDDIVLADFSDAATAASWLATSSVDKNVGSVENGYYYYQWTAYPTGGGYLAANPAKFAGLDFSNYKTLKLDISLAKDRAIEENYFTIVLSTSENPGNNFKTDECIAYEVDMTKLPMNKETSIYIPLEDMITEFDGMRNGVQGDANNRADLSDIKSISIYPGAAKHTEGKTYNGIGAVSDVFHNYTDWAFKQSTGEGYPKSCTMKLYKIELLASDTVEANIYNKDGTVFTNPSDGGNVCGRVTLSGYDADQSIFKAICLYKGGKLISCKSETGTIGDGRIETPSAAFEANEADEVVFYLWTDGLKPIINKVFK